MITPEIAFFKVERLVEATASLWASVDAALMMILSSLSTE